MCNVLLHVKKPCHVVISALELVTIANKVVHMSCANIHVVACLFVRIAVKQDVVNLALPATEKATDAALTGNVKNDVPSRVARAEDRAPGIALTTSAKISVERNAIALAVMLPVPKNCLVATPVLAVFNASGWTWKQNGTHAIFATFRLWSHHKG